ncbi:patatin (plasmid) [Mesorhizobium sp. 131-3-5]|uniref:CBASS cGAMP-activated phospholipase n=1 Tax=Mesorhizobium sp. 131-3-5 TaxID=2744520 RepID=UPI0018EB635C|nr:CBASS cGAMP-activated phospholipase [Mesorhizobium sp. 131-3-5]BCH12278.1 patatin [Mesorhizobium sp. 131-3-5]
MPFHILSLSGGGYRGLFTVSVLERLEQRLGRPIGECFDMIAGTSIGGIIAIGLGMGKTAKEILETFESAGLKIFPYRAPPRTFLGEYRAKYDMYSSGPKYDPAPLKATVDKVVGANTLLGEAKNRLLIPAVNMTKGSVQMFKTPHHPNFVIDLVRNAAEVAMATSAAPFYFPLASMGDSFYVDGGLVANSPDLCAVHEAINFCGQKAEDLRVLSIGTTTTGFSLPKSLGRSLSGKDWLTNERLISTIISSQQQMVDFMLRHQLGDRYLRIDAQPSADQAVDLGMDIATPDRRATLLGLAEGEYQKHAGSSFIAAVLAHRPPPIDFSSQLAAAKPRA